MRCGAACRGVDVYKKNDGEPACLMMNAAARANNNNNNKNDGRSGDDDASTEADRAAATAMHASLLSFAAANWPEYPIDADGVMQGLAHGKSLKIETIKTSTVYRPASIFVGQAQPESVLGLKVTAWPISERHERKWAAQGVQLSSVRPPSVVNSDVVVAYFDSVVKRRVVLRNQCLYDPADMQRLRASGVVPADETRMALLMRVHSTLMAGLTCLVTAMLDNHTDEMREFLNGIATQCGPFFRCPNAVRPDGTVLFSHRRDKELASLRLGLGNTVDIRVLDCDDAKHQEAMKRSLTATDVLRIATVGGGNISFRVPLSVAEVLLLQRAIVALIESVANSDVSTSPSL